MVFRKKKKVSEIKEYVDGEEVPPTIPELKVPVPSEEDKVKEPPLQAETVFAEGRSVGYQEGMIYAIELVQDHLKQHQDQLKAKIAEDKK